MANNRDTIRDYRGLGSEGYVNHATHSVTTVATLPEYRNYASYALDPGRVWGALEAARSGARNTRHGGPGSYMVQMAMPGLSPRSVLLADSSNLNWNVRQMIYDMDDDMGTLFNDVFGDGDYPVIFSIVKVAPRATGRTPVYRAPGRVWGYLGNKLLNCVTKDMVDMVTYYTPEGKERKYMWDSETGDKLPTDSGLPGYDQSAMTKLFRDASYRTIKKGIEQYMDKRGVKPHEDFGFEPRDLCELASLCNCRIVVWIESGNFRVCRHDSDDLVSYEGSRDNRYVFNFSMMSDQHLEILPIECISSGDSRNLISQRVSPVRSFEVVYLDDDEFEYILTREGEKSESDRRLYTLCKCVHDRVKKTIGFPESAINHKYSGWILTSGEKVFKHVSLKEWTEDLEQSGVMSKSQAATALSMSDVHSHRLRCLYKENNIGPIRQNATPRLYHAVKWADMQFGHMQEPMPEGSTMYEYDGRKWYLTDFSSMSEEEFPYFHGIPFSDCWSEYAGHFKDVHFVPGVGFKERVTMIGNHPGDRPFTFEYGSKYAIFQIDEIDLSGVSDSLKRHLERDGLFTGFDPVKDVIMLPSPVVHFLQDIGVVWRASRVWVCYGCGRHWVPEGESKDALIEEMKSSKTYPVVVGKLMCGRNPIQNVTYIAPDPDTAVSLQYFYSTQFSQGRLANEHRTSPDIIFEGEEREYDSDTDLREDTDPDTIIHSDMGGFIGTSFPSYSLVKNGGYIIPTVKSDEWDGKCPFYVETFQSTYNWARTYAHISGAQHAMCFVRLYQAVSKIDPSKVVGFSLDSIRTSEDVSESLVGMFGPGPGFFKPVQTKPYKCPLRRTGPMLSDLYTPRSDFIGINKPDPESPMWNAYKNSLGQFNIVTGKAGSGKTTRHLKKFGHGDADFRLPGNTVYMTMTNHLAHHVQTDLGVVSYTSFKGFNRRLHDEDTYVDPNRRFEYGAHLQSGNCKQGDNVSKLKGFHTVILDEVSMIDPSKILDIVEVCKCYHVQLLIVGDLDRSRFYQLSPVNHTQDDFFRVIQESETDLGVSFNWIEPMNVFRQTGDPELARLLDTLRESDGASAWKTLYESPIIRHITYDEMLTEFRPSKDLVAQPWHRIIGKVTEDVLSVMGSGDLLKLRGNFASPKSISGSHTDILSRFKMADSDTKVFKGSVCSVTKAELEGLRGTPLMSKKFPYAGASSCSNEVNPMIGVTVFNLQGLTLDEDATIYIHTESPGFAEWIDDKQPKLAYVAASRARRRGQIVLVTGRSNRPREDSNRSQRRRLL